MIDELKGKFNGMSIEINKKKELQQLEQAAKLSTYTTEPSQCFKSIFYDYDDDYDYEERSIPLRDIISKLPPSIAITSVFPTLEPEDSLIMGDKHLSTIPEKESKEFIKSSVEDLVPIPSESEDTSGSDSECILPSCDDFSPINVYKEKSVTFSKPLFNLNDDFTSSDDESLSDEDVPKDNMKIYSNPLFEFDDEYISSDVNPLFDEVLEDIECKDSYDSNLDEPTFLVTPLSDSNEDEFFSPGDDIEFLLHRDSSTPMISIVSILEGFTDEPPLEKNDDLFDMESKTNDWKKILYDAPIDDLMTEDYPGIHPGGDIDEIDAFLDVDISTDIEDGYHDSEGDILYLESLLSNDTILSLPPKVFLDHDSRMFKALKRSSAEAEYHGVANAAVETCWLRNLLRELHTPLSSDTLVYCDIMSAVYLSSNPVQHQRTKHIETDIHFVRDLVVVGQVRVLHVPSRYQYADIFTKA
ncbi:putative ribonuclease H-like domain-containing protein [Tanacetum coccineum]